MSWLLANDTFDPQLMMQLTDKCCRLILMLSAPMLIAALAVGVIIAVFQAVTQVQEQTLSFVPKIVATFLAVVIYGPWIANEVVEFTRSTLGMIPSFGPNRGAG